MKKTRKLSTQSQRDNFSLIRLAKIQMLQCWWGHGKDTTLVKENQCFQTSNIYPILFDYQDFFFDFSAKCLFSKHRL